MKKGKLWVIVLVVFVLVCMAISSVNQNKIGIISDITGIVLRPFQKLYVGVNNVVNYGFDYFQDMGELKEENAKLCSKVTMLEEDVAKNNNLKIENERLRGLVDLRGKNDSYEMTGASVTSEDPSGWFSYFLIDKGTKDGLKKNCVVLDSEGVLGHIDKIGSDWARVKTIVEPGSACGAEISRTGDTGIVEGDSLLGGLCKMTSISKEVSVIPGDYVVTSGSGDVYPAGLTIGKVKEITSDDFSQTAIVQPAANFKSPKEVLVITEVYPKTHN
ncbi:MAG: rod shape-determining protein MreC [Bacillota bacterium]|nr:rod shape-determining protein MreC [Bacillota bacterium]